MLPRVILHNGVSVDGRMDWFTGDVGLYYELAGRMEAEAMLSGSGTIAAAMGTSPTEEADVPEEPPQVDPADPRGWLVIVDSRGQFRNLHQLRRQPYWRGVIALCSAATPAEHLAYLKRHAIDTITAGEERVDLRAALAELAARYGVKTVRVDSGGVLNGVLLRTGLVDEVSILVNPALVGGASPRSIFVAPDLASADGVIPLRLLHVETLAEGAVWLQYQVVK